MIDSSFWKGRRVLITGHTGFKGSWLSLWLKQLDAKVYGFALEPPTDPAIFHDASVTAALVDNVHGDIRDAAILSSAMQNASPEIVIHMAAQSLVRESFVDPVETYSTNIMGTISMLEAVRNTPSVKAVLNITSDKCYENKEWVWGYRENEPMGGHDPYSNSKGCAELITSAYRRSFLKQAGIALATARSGNVIGGGDWAKDRLIPDAMRAFMEKNRFLVRSPMAVRPWQHVLEPLSGYLILCQQLVNHPEDYADGWNFGPNDEDAQPVSTMANILVNSWGDNTQWQRDDGVHPHEAMYLKLDCTKAKSLLKWKPVWSLNRALDETVKWYKSWHKKGDMHKFTLSQITSYQQEHTAG